MKFFSYFCFVCLFAATKAILWRQFMVKHGDHYDVVKPTYNYNPWRQRQVYKQPICSVINKKITCSPLPMGKRGRCHGMDCKYKPSEVKLNGVMYNINPRSSHLIPARYCKNAGQRCTRWGRKSDCNPNKFPNECHCFHEKANMCHQKYKKDIVRSYYIRKKGAYRSQYLKRALSLMVPDGCECRMGKLSQIGDVWDWES